MRFEGFIGGSGSALSLQADAERAVNFYVERIDSPTGRTKSDRILLSRPGLSLFCSLPAPSVQALCAINGRAFAAAGGQFFELLAGGNYTAYSGYLGSGRVQLCASQTQILILAPAGGYIFDLAASTLAPITAAGFPVGATKAAFIDGYFIVLEPHSQSFAISALNDGTQWDALDFGTAEGEAGDVVTLLADHRQLWLLANTHGEVYYDSGNANFPFSRLEGAFFEQGCAAIDSVVNIDNTILWLGQNRDGAAIVWRANGYTPLRVSTHAFESQVSQYPTLSDATAYCYQENGHTFYRLDFPSAHSGRGATWVYDIATGLWHERSWWNAQQGLAYADLARTHCFAFGEHLVGDYASGNVYIQSMRYATDNGAPIRRLRRAPALAHGGRRLFFRELRVLAETGVGLDGGLVPGSDPQLVLRWSNDGGKTFSSDVSRSLGPLGQYQTILRWPHLGSSFNRVFEVECAEPVFVALISAELDIEPEAR